MRRPGTSCSPTSRPRTSPTRASPSRSAPTSTTSSRPTRGRSRTEAHLGHAGRRIRPRPGRRRSRSRSAPDPSIGVHLRSHGRRPTSCAEILRRLQADISELVGWAADRPTSTSAIEKATWRASDLTAKRRHSVDEIAVLEAAHPSGSSDARSSRTRRPGSISVSGVLRWKRYDDPGLLELKRCAAGFRFDVFSRSIAERHRLRRTAESSGRSRRGAVLTSPVL